MKIQTELGNSPLAPVLEEWFNPTRQMLLPSGCGFFDNNVTVSLPLNR